MAEDGEESRRVNPILHGEHAERFKELEEQEGGPSDALRHLLDEYERLQDRVEELEEERDWLRDLVDDLRDQD